MANTSIIKYDLTHGLVALISGFDNATNQDRTNELKSDVLSLLAEYAPHVYAARGVWRGESENSLMVSLDNPSNLTIKEFKNKIRQLANKYRQIESIVGTLGTFFKVVTEDPKQDEVISDEIIDNFIPSKVEAYTTILEDNMPVYSFTIGFPQTIEAN